MVEQSSGRFDLSILPSELNLPITLGNDLRKPTVAACRATPEPQAPDLTPRDVSQSGSSWPSTSQSHEPATLKSQPAPGLTGQRDCPVLVCLSGGQQPTRSDSGMQSWVSNLNYRTTCDPHRPRGESDTASDTSSRLFFESSSQPAAHTEGGVNASYREPTPFTPPFAAGKPTWPPFVFEAQYRSSSTGQLPLPQSMGNDPVSRLLQPNPPASQNPVATSAQPPSAPAPPIPPHRDTAQRTQVDPTRTPAPSLPNAGAGEGTPPKEGMALPFLPGLRNNISSPLQLPVNPAIYGKPMPPALATTPPPPALKSPPAPTPEANLTETPSHPAEGAGPSPTVKESPAVRDGKKPSEGEPQWHIPDLLIPLAGGESFDMVLPVKSGLGQSSKPKIQPSTPSENGVLRGAEGQQGEFEEPHLPVQRPALRLPTMTRATNPFLDVSDGTSQEREVDVKFEKQRETKSNTPAQSADKTPAKKSAATEKSEKKEAKAPLPPRPTAFRKTDTKTTPEEGTQAGSKKPTGTKRTELAKKLSATYHSSVGKFAGVKGGPQMTPLAGMKTSPPPVDAPKLASPSSLVADAKKDSGSIEGGTPKLGQAVVSSDETYKIRERGEHRGGHCPVCGARTASSGPCPDCRGGGLSKP